MTYSSLPLSFAIIAALTLSACNGNMFKAQQLAAKKPAPISQYGASAGYGSRGVHTVLAGENLSTISKFYNLSVLDIAAENHLSVSDRLTKGMRLMLPPPQTYQVRSGDTVYSIARMFGIDPNHLTPQNGGRLQIGQALQIPHQARLSASPSVPEETMPLVSELSAPVAFVTQSPTLFNDSKNPRSVQVATLGPVSINRTTRTDYVIPGQKPFFNSQNVLQSPGHTLLSAPDIIQGPVGKSGFSRPVTGPILSSYGPKSGGLYNEGVNFAAPRGTPVRAAGSGTVIYTGNAIEGYGNLILLKHANGYISTYAHLDKTLVKDGQIVQRGQAIGTVGSTGNVKRAQLHFEIRKGRNSINPISML